MENPKHLGRECLSHQSPKCSLFLVADRRISSFSVSPMLKGKSHSRAETLNTIPLRSQSTFIVFCKFLSHVTILWYSKLDMKCSTVMPGFTTIAAYYPGILLEKMSTHPTLVHDDLSNSVFPFFCPFPHTFWRGNLDTPILLRLLGD